MERDKDKQTAIKERQDVFRTDTENVGLEP